MHGFWLALAAVNLIVIMAVAVDHYLGHRSIVWLSSHEPTAGPGQLPFVTIVVAARNEQRHIEPALQSLLQLDYDCFEIVAVDDRSTDRTGEIVDALALAHPRLQAEHVQELPDGWLGKNHALHVGAARARGQLLLFTDADVVMDRSVLRRAVSYLLENQLDHLTLSPTIDMPGWWLESFTVAFLLFFGSYTRPWRAKDPASAAHIGIGAFNLVRSTVYRALGGHAPIALRPDDDLKLGKLIKKNGYRQEMANGADLISVPWYGSIREVIVGLEKNAFAGVEYRLSLVALFTTTVLVFDVWPFLAVWLPLGYAQGLYALVVAVLLWMAWTAAGAIRIRRSRALGFPIAAALFVYIVWRAAWLTLLRRGIRWRDTVYPLAALKRNRI